MEAKWCHLNSCLGKTIGRLPITLLKADIFIATLAIPFFIKVARLQVAGCAQNRCYNMLWTGFRAQPQLATRNSGCVFISDGFRKESRRFGMDKASFSVGQYIVLFYRWARTKFYISITHLSDELFSGCFCQDSAKTRDYIKKENPQ